MLNKLSPQQEKLSKEMADEWIKFCLNGDCSIDEKEAISGINFLYELTDVKKPKEVLIVDDPFAAQSDANRRNGTKNYYYPMGIGLGYDAGWTAFYDFFTRIGILNDSRFDKWLKFIRSGVWDTLLFENVAYIVRRPIQVLKDTAGRLHCENGGAIAWRSGYKNYFWHGTPVTEKIILHPQDITKEEILSEKNSEVSRAIAEKLGWDEYLKRVDSILVDKWFDCQTKQHYELYDFKKRKGSMMPRLLKMESPELNDGTRPYYIEPVPPEIKTAQAARKWQFMKPDGSWPGIDECNANPELTFAWEA